MNTQYYSAASLVEILTATYADGHDFFDKITLKADLVQADMLSLVEAAVADKSTSLYSSVYPEAPNWSTFSASLRTAEYAQEVSELMFTEYQYAKTAYEYQYAKTAYLARLLTSDDSVIEPKTEPKQRVRKTNAYTSLKEAGGKRLPGSTLSPETSKILEALAKTWKLNKTQVLTRLLLDAESQIDETI